MKVAVVCGGGFGSFHHQLLQSKKPVKVVEEPNTSFADFLETAIDKYSEETPQKQNYHQNLSTFLMHSK